MQRTIVTLKKPLIFLIVTLCCVNPLISSHASTQSSLYHKEQPLKLWERYIETDIDSCKSLALHLRKNCDNSPYEAAVYHLISGSYLSRIGAFQEGIHQLKQAKSYFFQLQDFELLSKILNEIGIAFQLSGNTHEARTYYRHSMEAGRNSDNKLHAVLAEINLAKLAIEEEKYDQAFEHLQHYISVIKPLEKFDALANAHAAMADLFLSKDDIPNALYYCKEQQYYAGKTNNRNTYIKGLTNGAILAYYSSDFEKASQLFKRILSMRKNQDHPLKLAEAYFNLAGLYIENKPMISRLYLDSAAVIADRNKLFSMEEDILLFRKEEFKDSTTTKALVALKKKISMENQLMIKTLSLNDQKFDKESGKLSFSVLTYLLIGINIILIIMTFYNKYYRIRVRKP